MINEKILKYSSWLVPGIVFLGILVGFFQGWFAQENLETVAQNLGWFGLVFLFVVTVLSLIFSPLSSSLIVIIATGLYGPLAGGFMGVGAGLTGGSIDFWIARNYGRKILLRIIGAKNKESLTNQTDKLNRGGFVAVLIAMPLSLDLVSYATGLTNISFRKFIIALLIGSILNTLFVVLLGESILQLVF